MKWALLSMSLIILYGCGEGKNDRGLAERQADESITYTQVGLASFYSQRFSGEKTASGDIYDPTAMTAAHQDLPFGTVVEVINLENEKSVKVTINDRGPFVGQRIIDLSRAAAERLGFVEDGLVMVELKVIETADG
jgi:rare lipoprotein A